MIQYQNDSSSEMNITSDISDSSCNLNSKMGYSKNIISSTDSSFLSN